MKIYIFLESSMCGPHGYLFHYVLNPKVFSVLTVIWSNWEIDDKFRNRHPCSSYMCLYEVTTVTGIRRGRSQILRGLPRNICDPTSSNSGKLYVKKKN